jgi:NADH:ubiquinone oxidoreductase subunit
MVKSRVNKSAVFFNQSFRHRWLQYISDETPVEKPLKRQSWMIDTIENKTGTSQIYVPYTTVRTKIESWQPPLPSTTQNTTATKS